MYSAERTQWQYSVTLTRLLGLGIAPLLADHLGRKYSILVGCVIICLGAGLQAGALNVRMFTASRFFSKLHNRLRFCQRRSTDKANLQSV